MYRQVLGYQPGQSARPTNTGYSSYDHDMAIDPTSWAPGIQAGGAGQRMSTPMEEFTSQAEAASNRANQANQRRYQRVLRGWDQQQAQMLTNAKQFGRTALSDIGQRFRNLRGSVEQGLANRGLANSTIMPNMQTSLTQQELRARIPVQEQQAQMRNQIIGDIGQRKNATIENRTDKGPDMPFYAQIAQLLGAAGNPFQRLSRAQGQRSGGVPLAMLQPGGNLPWWGMDNQWNGEANNGQVAGGRRLGGGAPINPNIPEGLQGIPEGLQGVDPLEFDALQQLLDKAPLV